MPGTVTLLNPFIRGGVSPGLLQAVLSRLSALGVTVADPEPLAQWLGDNYQAGTDWMVMAIQNDTFSANVKVLSEGQRLSIWWGDGATETVFPTAWTSSDPRTAVSHNYADSALRPIVILGDMSDLRMEAPAAQLIVRAEHLPSKMRYVRLGSISQFNGSVLDLPRTLQHLELLSSGVLSGAAADLPQTLVGLTVMGDTQLTGQLSDLPPTLETLHLTSDGVQLTGSSADLPVNLTWLVLSGGTTVTGTVADLPRELRRIILSAGNEIAGGFADLPPTLEYLAMVSPDSAVFGPASDLPDTLTFLQLGGGNYVTGDPADLPTNLGTLLTSSESTDLNGDVVDLPRSLVNIDIRGVGVLTGDVADLPPNLTDINLYDENTVTGDFADLPDTIEDWDVRGNHTIGGDLSDLPAALERMTYVRLEATQVVSISGGLPTGLSNVYFYTKLDQATVDGILAAFWANKDEPKPRSDRKIDLAGLDETHISPPTDTSVADLLSAYRSPNNESQYLLWDVRYNPPPPPQVDVDVEIVNVGVSNLSVSNRTDHQYTYNFVSTTQDDTVVCLVLFLGDQGALSNVKTPVTTGLTKILESEHVDGGAWYGYYVPSQTDLNNGSVLFHITTSTLQVWQFVIMELKNADLSNLPTSMVADTLYSGSHDDRPNLSGGPLDVDKIGSLMVVSSTSDDTYEDHPTMSPDQGFTTVATYDGFPGMPGFHVAQKLATTTGSLATPTFNLTVSDEQNIMGVVVRGISEAGDPGGGGGPEEGEVSVLVPTAPLYASGVTQLLAPLPGYEVGDAVFATVFHQSDITPPTGWQLVAIQTNDSPTAVHFLSIYRRDMTDTSLTEVTWQQASSGRLGVAYAIARSNTGEVVVESIVQSNSQVAGSPYEHPVPGVTTTVDGSAILAVSSCSNSPASVPATYQVPADEQLLGWQQLTAAQVQARLSLATLFVETAGAVAGTVFEHTDVSAHHSAEIALVLAPSGEPVSQDAFFVMEAEDFV